MSRICLILVGIVACKSHDKTPPAAGSAAPVARAPISAPASPQLGSAERPALPENPADAGTSSADQVFADEAVEPDEQRHNEAELGKHLAKIPGVKSYECRSTQCRIIIAGKQDDVAKTIDELERAHELHTFARRIVLTAPTRNADDTVELHAFAQLK